MEKVFPILQSWLEKRLGEPAQFKTKLQFGQLTNQAQTKRRLVFQHRKKTRVAGS
jgi:hypothetical protein